MYRLYPKIGWTPFLYYKNQLSPFITCTIYNLNEYFKFMELITVTFTIFSTEMTKNNKISSLFNIIYVFSLKKREKMQTAVTLQAKMSWKSKSNPCTGRGFQGVEALRFQDNQHMKVVRLSALCTGRLYPTENIPDTHFCHMLGQHQGHRVTGRIMSMKKLNTTSGNRTCNLPACKTVPQ